MTLPPASNPTESIVDITIVGAGPAGLILAASLVEQGLTVQVVDICSRKSWTNNYCFWTQELTQADLSPNLSAIIHDAIANTWPQSIIHTNGQSYTLDTPYSKFDTTCLQRNLLSFLDRHLVQFHDDQILSVIHEAESSRLVGERGIYLSRLVIDAGGSQSGLLTRSPNPQPAFQIAYGQHLHFPDGYTHLFDANQVGFMNFRLPHGWKPFRFTTPSFLYVLPISDTDVFVEETVLATRNNVEFTELQERLDIRKQQWRCQDVDIVDEEFCRIEMGGALPKRGRTLAFGAAAGFTHPVTGYQIMRSIYLAPVLAQCLKAHWDLNIDEVTSNAWSVIWSPSALYNRRLYLLGLDLIARLKQPAFQSFFGAFSPATPPLFWASFRGYPNHS